MDLRTSTPIVLPKNFKQSSQLSNVSASIILNPKLKQADNNNKVNIKVNDSWYTDVDSPCYVDFQNGIPDPRDSFFDGRASCISTPISQQKDQSNLSTSNVDIIGSLKRCSISRIDDSINEGDSTLKASDCTVRQFQNSRHSMFAISPDPHRRLSRQSLTTVKPFSFEQREKERRERLEAKQHYINILKEQYNDSVKTKQVPKFRSAKKVNTIDTSTKVKLLTEPEKIINVEQNREVLSSDKMEFQTTDESNDLKVPDERKLEISMKEKKENYILKNQTSHITGQVNEIAKIFDKKKPPDPITVHITAKTSDKPASKIRVIPTKPLVADINNVPDKHRLQVGNKKEINDSNNKKLIEPWKQKPFQISLPKRAVCIPRSPKLRTAQRARARQLFDDKLKEREKQQEEMRKQDAIVREKREKQDIQNLRKQLIHKAMPVPVINSKRTLTDPTIPIVVKRRKLNNYHNTNNKTNKAAK